MVELKEMQGRRCDAVGMKVVLQTIEIFRKVDERIKRSYGWENYKMKM